MLLLKNFFLFLSFWVEDTRRIKKGDDSHPLRKKNNIRKLINFDFEKCASIPINSKLWSNFSLLYVFVYLLSNALCLSSLSMKVLLTPMSEYIKKSHYIIKKILFLCDTKERIFFTIFSLSSFERLTCHRPS